MFKFFFIVIGEESPPKEPKMVELTESATDCLSIQPALLLRLKRRDSFADVHFGGADAWRPGRYFVAGAVKSNASQLILATVM